MPASAAGAAVSANATDGRYPTPFLTLLFALRRRRSVPEDVFFAYWRDVHCQIWTRRTASRGFPNRSS